MPERRTADYFSFAGVRTLLAAFRNSGIPADRGERGIALQPALRALWYSGERGGRTLAEVGAELRCAAALLAASPEAPPEALANIPRATVPEQTSSALREIADLVDDWPVGFVNKLTGAVPTSEELRYRFPLLGELLTVYFGQDGEATEDDLTEVQGLEMYISHVHPICLWQLPGLVAECHEALASFHDESSLVRFFEVEHEMGSGSLSWCTWLPLISEVFMAHLREHHPAHWQD